MSVQKPIVDPSTLTEEQRELILQSILVAPGDMRKRIDAAYHAGWNRAIMWIFGEKFCTKIPGGLWAYKW